MVNPPQYRNTPFTTVEPPPAQGLAVSYLGPLLSPTPVATRLPVPGKTEDTVNAFLRIEAAGGGPLGEQLLFQASIILHSYCTNNDESLGEQVMGKALAWAGNAQGQFITHKSTGVDWFVASSSIASLAHKYADPSVALTRFRGMVTWVIQGRALEAPTATVTPIPGTHPGTPDNAWSPTAP